MTGPPPAEQIQRLVPHARVVALPRVGHSPHVERPEETAGLVRAFADAIDR